MTNGLSVRTKIFLGLLLALSLFVRLYRIDASQTFLEDEGRDLLIVKRMVDTGRPVLLGPQTSIGGMYLGPFYYYFISPALIVSGMEPIGPAVLIAFTGMLTVTLLFFLVKNWLGERTAWFAASLYAFMPLAVTFTRNSWNPNLAPLVTLLILWALDHLSEPGKNKNYWFALLGLLTGLLLQLHYMALIFVGFYCLLIIFWWRTHLKELLFGILSGIAGFAVSVLPLIIFELRNGWVNTNSIIRFIKSEENPNIRYSPPFWLWRSKVESVIHTLFGGLLAGRGLKAPDQYSWNIAMSGFLLTLASIFFSSLTSRRKQMLAIGILGSLAVLGLYQEGLHVHYIGFLFIPIYLSFASLVSSKTRALSYLGQVAVIGVLLMGIPLTWTLINSNSNNQVPRAREVAEYISKKSLGEPYNLVSRSDTSTTPFQYFTYLQPNPPSNDWADRVFLICQDTPCEESDATNKGLFITGPAHPSLGDYVGHPLASYIVQDAKVVSNEHVSHGTWVAEIKLIGDK